MTKGSKEEWKRDMDALVMERMSIDEFLEKWSGIEVSEGQKGAEEPPAPVLMEDKRLNLRKLLEEARKKLGV